ncbi:hypothetical protein ACR6C2_07415 [Streptomyces sp. INA 01156]
MTRCPSSRSRPVHGAGGVRLPLAAWTMAARLVVELHGVTPADLEREWAALGRDRLEEEFARVAERIAA